mgnify:CR=1 FL=1
MYTNIKSRIKTVFNAAAEKYDRNESGFFSYFGRRAVELANIPPKSRVLDVGTGRGTLLFPAINRVGYKGEVFGIDISDRMVRLTAAEITSQGISNARVLRMDAEHLVFPDNYFDFILCGFAILFFPNPELAIKEFFRVLKNGGKLVVTTSGKPDPQWRWFGLLLEKYHRDETLVNSAVTSATLKELILKSGFSHINIETENKIFTYQDEKEWWNTYMSHGGVRDAIFKMEKSLQFKFKQESIRYVRRMKQESGLHHNRTVLFTIGTK